MIVHLLDVPVVCLTTNKLTTTPDGRRIYRDGQAIRYMYTRQANHKDTVAADGQHESIVAQKMDNEYRGIQQRALPWRQAPNSSASPAPPAPSRLLQACRRDNLVGRGRTDPRRSGQEGDCSIRRKGFVHLNTALKKSAHSSLGSLTLRALVGIRPTLFWASYCAGLVTRYSPFGVNTL